LRGADLEVENVELHDDALAEMVQQIRTKLLGAEIMVGLRKLNQSGLDFGLAGQVAKSALAAIRQGQLGYAIITASKSRLVASRSGPLRPFLAQNALAKNGVYRRQHQRAKYVVDLRRR